MENPRIKWRIRSMQFADKWEAFEWMYKHHIGRRNLTEEQKKMIWSAVYEAKKHIREYNREPDGRFRRIQNGSHGDTRVSKQVADELGIGKGTLIRATQFARGIDAIKECEPEFAEKILNAETKIPHTEIQKIGVAEPEDRSGMIQSLKEEGRAIRKPIEKKEEKKESKEEKQKRLDEIRAIKEVAGELFEPPKEIRYTIDSLVKDIENNAVPFIRLFRQIVEGNKKLCVVNKGMVIKAIHENIITKIEEIEKEIEDYE
jgi:hypothetical protein